MIPKAELFNLSSQAELNRLSKSKDAEKASIDFEALLVKEMYKSMTKTLPNGLFGKQAGGDWYEDMLLDKVAHQTALGGSFGIAKQINAQINGEQNRQTALRQLDKVDFRPPARYMQAHAQQSQIDQKLAPYAGIIRAAADKWNLEENLIKAVIINESNADKHAVSPAGAKGLMQIMDATALELGVKDVFSAADNIHGGAKYLYQLMKKYDDKELALAAYNAGPGNVDRYGGVPPFAETQTYLRRVLDTYKQLSAGGEHE